MIIDIQDELFYKIVSLMKPRTKKVYNQLLQIKPLDTIPNNTLENARAVKTSKIKVNTKKAIQSLINENIKVSKYQVHKRTGIAYVTLNKYYDVILDEVQSEC